MEAGVLSQEQADKVLADFDAAAASGPVADAKTKIQADAAQIQQLADGSAAVSDGAAKLAAAAPALTGGMPRHRGSRPADIGSSALAAGSRPPWTAQPVLPPAHRTLDSGAAKLERRRDCADGAGTLADGAGQRRRQVPNPDDAQKSSLSKVIADPVAVSNVSQAKAGSYGAGLARFSSPWLCGSASSCWSRPCARHPARPGLQRPGMEYRRRRLASVPGCFRAPGESAHSGGGPGAGPQPCAPGADVAVHVAAAMAFSALIQGIVALLGAREAGGPDPAGASAGFLGGTFPWQTTPQPLHVVHDVLPMGYVVTGLRHLIYGADLSLILPTVAGLLGYTVLGAALSTLAVRKHQSGP